MSIFRFAKRLSDGGTEMTAQSMVVDVSEDWAIACDVQQRFMQHSKPATNSGISYSAYCRQARAVGGDFYDFLRLSDHRVALAIGDASGKSLPAALMISSVQSSLRTAAHFAGDEAAVVLRTVNSLVQATSLEDRYATVFYGVFEEKTRALRYVNAGHIPPVIVRRDGSLTRLLTGGAPVGMFAEWEYEEGAAHLLPGDLLVACTDGVTESVNSADEQWGIAGLLAAIEESQGGSPDEIALAILREMDEFSGGRQMDDATVVVVRTD
jgi:sigma-B regulation protein RsbU (phosphoserine phosphatase)